MDLFHCLGSAYILCSFCGFVLVTEMFPNFCDDGFGTTQMEDKGTASFLQENAH